MPVRLRFSLHGHRHSRIFHLVAVEQGARRDAKPTELLGIYNRYAKNGEAPKTIEWSVDRIRYWLNVGAIPTRSVAKLLETGNILKPNSPYHSNAKRAHASIAPLLTLKLEAQPAQASQPTPTPETMAAAEGATPEMK